MYILPLWILTLSDKNSYTLFFITIFSCISGYKLIPQDGKQKSDKKIE